MKSEGDTSKKRIIRFFKLFKMVSILILVLVICYVYRNHVIYDSINVSIDKVANINYGSNEFDINEYIAGYEGERLEVISDIDTKKIGKQEIVVEITKSGVTKEIPIIVNVVDGISPSISINEEKVIKNKGDSFDINSNISEVLDNVDGNLTYLANEEVTDEKKSFYTFYSDSDINLVGSHNIFIKAVDGSGNVTEKTFVYEVKEIIIPNSNIANNNSNNIQLNYNLPPNGSANGIVSLAYSLVGGRYVSGGTTPAGFDCSGFVQYVYAQNGISISRSSYTQAYDGVAVPYSEAQPGDILSWGTSMGNITHSALYVGNGMMIHAANPSQGVLLSNVDAWTRGSGTRVITTRRVI